MIRFNLANPLKYAGLAQIPILWTSRVFSSNHWKKFNTQCNIFPYNTQYVLGSKLVIWLFCRHANIHAETKMFCSLPDLRTSVWFPELHCCDSGNNYVMYPSVISELIPKFKVYTLSCLLFLIKTMSCGTPVSLFLMLK